MKKILFVLLAMLLLLTGCSTEGVAHPRPETYVQDISPSLLRIGDLSINSGYCYLVDTTTGVVYLEFDSDYRHAITVMLNADGSPITAEQLGIKYQ